MSAVISFPRLGIELAINKVAFTVFGIQIYWYGLLIALGTLLAVMYAFQRLNEFGLDQDNVTDVILVGTICAMIGSRLYYVIFSEKGEFTSLRDILDIRQGGVAFYGAVIGAFVSAAITCRIKKLKVRPVADLAAIGFVIGQGIGRWGNFINQEAFGSNTTLPWGMTSEQISQYLRFNQLSLAERGMQIDPFAPVHPTFLYESLWCLLGFVLLTLYIKRRKFDGEIFLIYLAWNGAGRSVIEGLRTDSLYLGSVRISQILAFTGFIVAVLAVLILRKHVSDKRIEDPEYAVPYGHTEQCKADMAALAELRELKNKGKSDAAARDASSEEASEDDESDDSESEESEPKDSEPEDIKPEDSDSKDSEPEDASPEKASEDDAPDDSDSKDGDPEESESEDNEPEEGESGDSIDEEAQGEVIEDAPSAESEEDLESKEPAEDEPGGDLSEDEETTAETAQPTGP